MKSPVAVRIKSGAVPVLRVSADRSHRARTQEGTSCGFRFGCCWRTEEGSAVCKYVEITTVSMNWDDHYRCDVFEVSPVEFSSLIPLKSTRTGHLPPLPFFGLPAAGPGIGHFMSVDCREFFPVGIYLHRY